MDYTISKMIKLKDVDNDMVHNFYYLNYCRLYNDDRNKYRKFKFITFFDIFDVQNYYDKEIVTKDDIKEYARDLAFTLNINNYITNYNDIDGLKKLYQYCNDTIKEYNRIC